MYIIKLFIPCEIEERRNKQQPEYVKIEKVKGENILLLNSPIIQINKLSSMDLLPNYRNVDKILESCNLSSLGRYHFIIDNVVAPYGVVLSTTTDSYKEMMTIVRTVNSNFRPEPFFSDKNRPYWIIYDSPIVLVECAFSDRVSHITFCKKLQNNHLYDSKMKFGHSYICVKDNVVFVDTYKSCVNSAVIDVLNVYMAINQLWSRVRIEGKKLGSNSEWEEKEKREKLIQIHEMCAIFSETTSATIFFNCAQRKIFDFLYPCFRVKEKSEQITGAKEHADYLVAENVNQKASSINVITFVTGYIGILLAFFAFFPLEVQNIVWINQSIHWGFKVLIYLLIAGIFAVVSWGTSQLYTKYLNRKYKCKFWRYFKWVFPISIIAISVTAIVLLQIFGLIN